MLFLTTQAEDEEERQKNETYKLLASEQRASVSQLYLERNRPSLDNDVSNVFLKFSKIQSQSLARLVHLDVSFGGKQNCNSGVTRHIMAENAHGTKCRENRWALRQMSKVAHYSENIGLKGYCGIFFQPYSELYPPKIRIKHTFHSVFSFENFRPKQLHVVAYNKMLFFVTFRQDPFVACAVSKHFLDLWRQFLR